MKTIYLNAIKLKVMRLFAAKQDIRYYLNGLLVQATAQQTRLVATDGTMLTVFDDAQENEGVTFDEFIVPNETLDALKLDTKLLVRITIDGGRFRIAQYPSDAEAIDFKPVDGRYPDYLRVIPVTVSGQTAQFRGANYAVIDKAQRLVNKANSAHIWHNGIDSALFQLSGVSDFIGVVMPLRFNKRDAGLPVPDVTAFRRSLPVEKVALSEAADTDTADDLL